MYVFLIFRELQLTMCKRNFIVGIGSFNYETYIVCIIPTNLRMSSILKTNFEKQLVMIKHSLEDKGGNWYKFRIQNPKARSLVSKGWRIHMPYQKE